MSRRDTELILAKQHIIDSYRPDVDGLRAVAVLAVIGFHAFPQFLNGGFVGVDVFFVISGFLISSIILKALDDGRFTFAGFYARRIRRIFPALVVVLASCLAIGWYKLYPDELRMLGKHAAAGAGFVYNFVAWFESGYFDPAAVTKPLLHLWSLGVEEQFYLAWPLLLVYVHRRTRRIALVLASVALVSFGLNLALVEQHPVGTFYAPWTRLWELAAGSVLACHTAVGRDRNRTLSWMAPVIAWIGLAMVIGSLMLIDRHKSFPGWWALLPTAGTFALIASGPDTWLHRKLLANRLMVTVGLISYPLYLWHWPLLSLAHTLHGETPPREARIAIVLASFVLAGLTYALVEKPIRFKGPVFPRVTALAVSMSLVLVAGVLIQGGRIPSSFPQDQAAYIDYFENSAPAYRHFLNYETAYRDDCNFYDFRRNQPRPSISASCYTPNSPRIVLVWGDSHAQQYFHGLRAALPSTYSVLQVATSGCNPSLRPIGRKAWKHCDDSNAFALQVAMQVKPQTVILAQSRGHHLTDWNQVGQTLKQNGVSTVIVLGPVPHWRPALHKVIASTYWESTPQRIATHLDQDIFATDRVLHERYPPGSGVTFVSLLDRLCDTNGCLSHLDGDRRDGIFTWDAGHITLKASEFIARRFLVPVVVAAVERTSPPDSRAIAGEVADSSLQVGAWQ